MLFIKQESAKPNLNFIVMKYILNKDHIKAGYEKIPKGGKPIGYNIHRFVMAGAMFTDSAICYSHIPTSRGKSHYGYFKDFVSGINIWDEFWSE